jgi:hypothetical protein
MQSWLNQARGGDRSGRTTRNPRAIGIADLGLGRRLWRGPPLRTGRTGDAAPRTPWPGPQPVGDSLRCRLPRASCRPSTDPSPRPPRAAPGPGARRSSCAGRRASAHSAGTPSRDSYTTGSRRRTARSRTARHRGSRPWPTRRPPIVLARTRRHSRLASAGRRPASDSSPILHGRWGDRSAGRFDEGGNRLQRVRGPFEAVQAVVDAIQRFGVAQCSHRPDPTGSARVHVIGSRAGTSGYARASHTRRLFRVR